MRSLTAAQRINGALRRIPAWPIYILVLAWTGWLFSRALGGEFVDPVVELEHRSGLLALQLLVAGLAVTPLRELTGVSLVRYRRALGLSAFFLVLFHMLVWAALDLQALDRVIADILRRPYITVGMLAFAAMIPLALTSNDWSIRRLGGAAWRRLHWLTYPAVLLGAVHFAMLRKTWQSEPLTWAGVVLVLLAWRPAARTVRAIRRRRADAKSAVMAGK